MNKKNVLLLFVMFCGTARVKSMELSNRSNQSVHPHTIVEGVIIPGKEGPHTIQAINDHIEFLHVSKEIIKDGFRESVQGKSDLLTKSTLYKNATKEDIEKLHTSLKDAADKYEALGKQNDQLRKKNIELEVKIDSLKRKLEMCKK